VQFRCNVTSDNPKTGDPGTYDNGRSTLPSKDNEETDMADVDVGAAVGAQSSSGTSAARAASYLLFAAAVGCAATIVGL